jgi:ABC-2 type transport system ATP-binding protein
MSQPAIEAHTLAKSFGNRRVLDSLSFEVRPGEVVGLLGKNGAGKTTLLELILGFSPPDKGRVRVFGHDSVRLPGEIKGRIGFVPQQDELIDSLTAEDQSSDSPTGSGS